VRLCRQIEPTSAHRDLEGGRTSWLEILLEGPDRTIELSDGLQVFKGVYLDLIV
jgi:hypothetical protein